MDVVPKYNRNYKGSLYAMGYSDGYSGNERDPHWNINDGYTDEKITVTLEEEIEEYDQGYNDGKFHFSIDKKH